MMRPARLTLSQRFAGMALLVTLVSCVEISQELRIHHREFYWPQVVDKAAVEELVDASAGDVEVSYLLTVENVQVQNTDGAEIAWIRVKNKRSRAITVQIKDTLYCDAGGGTPGSPVAEVYASGDVLIGAGDTFSAGPFPEINANACSDTDGDGIREVVNRVEVFSAGGAALLAARDFGADYKLPISGIVVGRLVDVEELPAGWSVDAVGVAGPGSAWLTIDESAAGSTHTTAFEPVGGGEFVLTKRLVRADGTECEPQVIENRAFMKDPSPSETVFGETHEASVDLLCPEGGLLLQARGLRVFNSQWWEPQMIAAAAPVAVVDGGGGAATVELHMEVDYVQLEDHSGASIDGVLVRNPGPGPVTVDVEAALSCDDGSGGPGAPVGPVAGASGVTIAAGATWEDGPFGGFDVTHCNDVDGFAGRDLVLHLEVREPGGSVLAAADFDTEEASAISGISAGRLTEVEQIPAGWNVTDVGMTRDGLPFTDFTHSVSGDRLTVHSSDVQIAPGDYTLTKVLTSEDGRCQPGVVATEAYVENSIGDWHGVFGESFEAEVAITCEPPPGWGWKKATDPDDAMSFLNGTGAYGHPVEEARIGAFWTGGHREFYIFYRRGDASTRAGWGWKLATDPHDVHNFLNGAEGYSQPVGDAQICAMWRDGHREFYVFYRRPAAGEEVDSWGWKLAPDPGDAMDFLNGTGAYSRPVGTARIASIERDGAQEYYVFYQRAASDPGSGGWAWKRSTDVDDAYNFVNGRGVYGGPVEDFELGAVYARDRSGEYFMFYR